MIWAAPRFDRPTVDRAGKTLRHEDPGFEELVEAYEVLDNWRASHAFPLNTFQVVLRGRAREVAPQALVAQRLKRVPSILRKLADRPTMRLTQMQDVGGCRAVVPTLSHLGQLADMYSTRRTSSEFVNSKDYILEPAPSGYRSIHLIYRYRNEKDLSLSAYNGHLIEIQLRTQVQHAWATAVETVGTVIGSALKSSDGPDEWLTLLRHISSVFAYYEGTPPLEGAMSSRALIRHVRTESKRLRLAERLTAFGNALRLLEGSRSKQDRYFLLRLDPSAEQLEISSYRAGEVDLATERYLELERTNPGGSNVDVVLVRADSVDALRRAYPNYFLDTQFFLSLLEEITAATRRAV